MKQLLLLSVFLIVTAAPASGQKIAVVSEAEVMKVYPPAVKVEAELQALVKSWLDTGAIYQKAINDKIESYVNKWTTMLPEQQKNVSDTIARMRQALYEFNERNSNTTNGEFFRIRTERYAPILKSIRDAIARVALREKVDIVTNREAAGYVATDVIDLTAEVVKELK